MSNSPTANDLLIQDTSITRHSKTTSSDICLLGFSPNVWCLCLGHLLARSFQLDRTSFSHLKVVSQRKIARDDKIIQILWNAKPAKESNVNVSQKANVSSFNFNPKS